MHDLHPYYYNNQIPFIVFFFLLSPRRHFQDLQEQHFCHKCHPGSYTNKKGTAICTPCPVNTYQGAAGKDGCLDCPPDIVMTIQGAVSCSNNCRPGTISLHNNNRCESCQPGRFQPGGGATSCMPCPLGWSQPNSGQIECIRAEPGNCS